ncbi:MAG: acetamidase/formamidase family protein [Trueperaceae bacterium]
MRYDGARTIHDTHVHHGWDRSIAPVAEVDPGSEVQLQVLDASGGQLHADATVQDVADLDFARVNPVTGPVHVRGAEPGDVLEVRILELGRCDWGWTALIPGFGLLADEFPEPELKIWSFDDAMREAVFRDDVRIPVRPFPGTIGVAPAEPGLHSIVPPRACGGNMDVRHLVAGSTLYLPVQVEGALFSAGDTHAAQGDGEVCGTAIETSLDLTVRLDVRRDLRIRQPQFDLPGPLGSEGDAAGFRVATGIHEDLMEAARLAVRHMIEVLVEEHAFSETDAYMLCSVAVDLKIHELVDAPNWVVGAFLPKGIFRR